MSEDTKNSNGGDFHKTTSTVGEEVVAAGDPRPSPPPDPEDDEDSRRPPENPRLHAVSGSPDTTPEWETLLFDEPHKEERAVLTCVFLDNDTFAHFLHLTPEDFEHPSFRLIFASMVDLRKRNESVDAIAVAHDLQGRRKLESAGGWGFLLGIVDQFAVVAYAASYARSVAQRAQKRRSLRALTRAHHRLQNGHAMADVWRDVETTMRDERQGTEQSLHVRRDSDDTCQLLLDRFEGRESPVATPWDTFNARMGGGKGRGGLWPGMYVLVGNTGSGKTQWAIQMVLEGAQVGLPVLYLALELSRVDLRVRMLGALSQVPWSGLLHGSRPLADVETALLQAEVLDTLPIYVECGAPMGYGVDTMLARAMALRPKILVLDYLQLCAGKPGEDVRVTVGQVSYAARAIARDLGCVVLVLSSTARANYAQLVADPNADPASFVGMGKESGEIEYAADGVFVMARDPNDATGSTRHLIIAKHRYGETSRVTLSWNGTRFTDPAVLGMAGPAPAHFSEPADDDASFR